MIRAQYKDENYFEEFIFLQEERIDKFTKVLESIDSSDTAKRDQCKKMLAGFYLDFISAKYSLGLSKEEIKDDAKKYIQMSADVKSYNEMVNILSVMILFELKDADKSAVMATDGFDDALVKRLKKYIDRSYPGDNEEDTLMFPDSYKIFYDYLRNRVGTKEFISYVDKNWYSSCKENSFYDSHKKDTKTFTGYWCWVAASVLKMKAGSKVSGKYIPYELI